MWVTSSCNAALTPTAVALGNFDGLHLGHRQVVQPILNRLTLSDTLGKPRGPQPRVSVSLGEGITCSQEIVARDGEEPSSERHDCELNHGPEPMTAEGKPLVSSSNLVERAYRTVVTFNPHPQEYFSGQPRQLLTPLPEKVELLQAMGVEQLVLLPFDRELAALTPAEFVEEILVRQLQAQQISVGLDFRFGQNRAGTAADLQAIAASFGIEVTLVPLQTSLGERISSSVIRQALCDGDLSRANSLLGRPYKLVGQVVTGQQLGRTIGFPTANLQFPPEKFLPRFGVYAVRASIQETATCHPLPPPSPLLGVMNVGCRPTVEGQHPTVEVHLLDWGGDLYGKTLTVSLEHFLRPEQKFPSLEALKAQILADCAVAKRVLTTNG
ncbi:MAG: bifunctional riboflavin kinase/FAD synthetase [Actinomycetota bacterium]